MLEEARAAGFRPSGRLLGDWVSLGLLDQAKRRGLGRGKGTIATWPEEQFQLFLQLLSKRPEVTQIATLCNLPVGLWLWWGSPYVETRQARRALSTWTGNSQRVSWRRSRWIAQQLVDTIAHEDAAPEAREAVVDAIARAAYSRSFPGDEILRLLRPVFDPHSAGRRIGPPAVNVTAESFVLLTEVRLNAAAALQREELDARAFEWARNEYRESKAESLRLIPAVAADPEASDLFLKRSPQGVLMPPTLEDAFNRACVDLLTLLGFYLYRHTETRT